MPRPGEIINIIVRRRWVLIIPFCIFMVIGCYLALTLPKIYKATTLILVEPQRVPSSYVQPLMTTDISSRLRTISEQVMSRTNIQRIIDTYRMFTGPEYADMFIEDKIESVRKRIQLDVKQASTFSIAFKGKDPERVKNVANALASYFIDQNLKDREAQAVGTSGFLDDELKSMRQRLEKSEQRLTAYRQKYMGELPDQLESNLSVLNRYSQQLIEKQKALREAQSNFLLTQQQISADQTMQPALPLDIGDSDTDSDSGDLDTLKAKLTDLKTRYTDQYPDVLRLQAMIDKLKAKQAQEKAASASSSSKADNALPPIDFKAVQAAQLEESKHQIKEMQKEVADLKHKVHVYQDRVENTPKREQDMAAIQRDYDNVKDMYDSLLKRRLEAEISVNMEKKQKGEQFRVIDPARLPEKPISPNMGLLFCGTLALALGVGGGIVFILEYLDNSFRCKEDVASALGVTVLAAVPKILQPKEQKRRRLEFGFSILSVCFSVGLILCLALITANGPERIIEIVKRVVPI
jgi:polysaccharide chain length determinant protein (PEP-CTERM system associated)